jgi:hypothetical protein
LSKGEDIEPKLKTLDTTMALFSKALEWMEDHHQAHHIFEESHLALEREEYQACQICKESHLALEKEEMARVQHNRDWDTYSTLITSENPLLHAWVVALGKRLTAEEGLEIKD